MMEVLFLFVSCLGRMMQRVVEGESRGGWICGMWICIYIFVLHDE